MELKLKFVENFILKLDLNFEVNIITIIAMAIKVPENLTLSEIPIIIPENNENIIEIVEIDFFLIK